VETVAFSGPTAQVNYWKSTGCTTVSESGTASTSRARLARETTRVVNVYMDLSVGDFCTGTVRNYSCYTDSGSVNVSRNLGGATVEATLTCADVDTGETTCQLSKHEELQGYGDISSERYEDRSQYGSYTSHQAVPGAPVRKRHFGDDLWLRHRLDHAGRVLSVPPVGQLGLHSDLAGLVRVMFTVRTDATGGSRQRPGRHLDDARPWMIDSTASGLCRAEIAAQVEVGGVQLHCRPRGHDARRPRRAAHCRVRHGRRSPA
jgi:hypothetical protein